MSCSRPPRQRGLITYREIGGWKYQLVEPYAYHTGFKIPSAVHVGDGLLKLDADGLLFLASGYSWDGPSGPAIDSNNWMRGSLVHDGIYQLMREGLLAASYRKPADILMRKILIEDGMSRLRAWYSYLGVRVGGSLFAERNTEKGPRKAP